MCGVCLLVREAVSGQTCHTVCLSRALGTCYSHVSGCVMLPNTLHIPDRDDHHATHTSNNLQASRCYSYSTAGTCSCGSASSRRPNKMGPRFRHTTFATVGRRYFSRYTAGDMPPTARTIPPWRTLFFGTDWFATQHLKMLNLNRLKGDPKVVGTLDVVVPSEKCPVGQYCQQNGLPMYKWPLQELPGEYDIGAVVSFGHLIPKRTISVFPYGILNVHASVLPRWRGASPIMHTILSGDEVTGISIIEIRPHHFDIGPLLMQSRYPVPENCTTKQLEQFLAGQGSHMLLYAFQNVLNLERREHEQKHIGVTYAHKLTAMNAHVDWENQKPEEIDAQFRALGESLKLRSKWNGKPVKFLDMVSLSDMASLGIGDHLEDEFPQDSVCVLPGIPFYHRSTEVLCIKCLDGWVGFQQIVLKKPMSAKAFYNGYLSKPQHTGVAFESCSNELDKYTFRTTAAQVKLFDPDHATLAFA
ncbi:hypothetical protein NP493_538g04039 [Ridgeia piscesae]|uniref:Methionyl-tRNA formyltransferase, mitochondrial n=1 Tax=Ridgeia piscesae TaxID=27915 RepID=A0AAD9NQF3_RIDPI|nr:hypothetical protein NP493_538g04039 [Ridgeia piscesae]